MEQRNGLKQNARIRIMSLGNAGVGKSCLIKRYCEKRFQNKYIPTVGIDYGSTIIDLDDRKMSVHLFDPSGSPIFKQVRNEFYNDMQGILLVYDVTNPTSFRDLDNWVDEISQKLGPPSTWKLSVVVCGNRIDTGGTVGRQVSEIDGSLWAEKYRFIHLLASAALGQGVQQTFHTLFLEALQLKEGSHTPGSVPPVVVDPETIQAIQRLINIQDDFEKLSLNRRGASKDDVNRAYRKFAGMVHPDKCKASGAEEAFKALTQARNNLLKMFNENN